MSISTELRNAYNFQRAWLMAGGRARFPAKQTNAADALRKAREDIAAGKKRYTGTPWAKPYAAVSWSREDDGLAFVQSVSGAGVRIVVENAGSEKGGRNSHNGWYTNDDGESFRDGTGLIWGIVALLPHGRFYPGYVCGGHGEENPTIDFSRAYAESDDCIHIADSMAEYAADTERDYQRAYEAGRKAAESMREVRELGNDWLADYRRLRVAFCERWQAIQDCVPMVQTREWLRQTIAECRDGRDSYREARAKAFAAIDENKPYGCDASGKQAFWAGYADA